MPVTYRIDNHVSQGLQSPDTPANKMTWFKSNFNMPVPNIYDSVYVDPGMRYEGNATYLTETLSYDLAGFEPGYEVCQGTSVWDIYNGTAGDLSGSTYLYQRWTDPAVTTTLVEGFWEQLFDYDLPSGYYTTIWAAINIGIASWEISTSDTYHFRSSMEEPLDTTVDTEYSDVVISNCPSTTKLADGKQGYIWVEGNDLCYVNNGGGSTGGAGGWKHTMVGVDISGVIGTPGVSKAGYFWLDDTDFLIWVGGDGKPYTPQWESKQHYSWFDNGATTKWLNFTASTDDTITSSSHGFQNGDEVQFTTAGGTLPAPLTDGDFYFVIDRTTNTFKVSTSLGGSAVNITSTGTTPNYVMDGPVFAGTSNAGKIWVDTQFGNTHLAYIAKDGWKYITGAGDDPYA